MAVSPILFVIIFSTKKLYKLQSFHNIHYIRRRCFLPILCYILRINPVFNTSHTKEKLNNVFGIVMILIIRSFFLKAYKT